MDVSTLIFKLGSFLIILPVLLAAQLVTISMPQYAATNSELRVKCDFTGFPPSGLLKMVLHFGTSMASVYYDIVDGKYTLEPTPGISFETGSGTTVQEGSITFVFSRIGCDKFTTYYCQGDGLSPIKSSNRTLQVRPQIRSIRQTSGSLLTVNEISTFTCRGTISTEGPFSVQWYRNTITINNKLQAPEARVIGTSQCARTLSSTLNYNVSQFDHPNLLLWCRISAQQNVHQSANFPVQEMSTAAIFTPGLVKILHIKISMPQSAFRNTEVSVTCRFKSALGLSTMILFHGTSHTTVFYSVILGKFYMKSVLRPTVEIGPGTTPKNGSFTFIFSQIGREDFTWYTCQGTAGGFLESTSSITLQEKSSAAIFTPRFVKSLLAVYVPTFMVWILGLF